MYWDTPEVLEALKNVPLPPAKWDGFKNIWSRLAAAAECVTRNPDGTESAVWVRGWRGRELHAKATWDADGRFSGSVTEYSFRDVEDREGTEVFRKEVTSGFALADWLMEYGY